MRKRLIWYLKKQVLNLKLKWYNFLLGGFNLKLEKVTNRDFFVVSQFGLGYRKNQLDPDYTSKEKMGDRDEYIFSFEDLDWLLEILSNNRNKVYN